MPGEGSRAGEVARLLGFLLAYALLAVAVTHPLAFRLGDGVPHDWSDPLLNVWVLWWNGRSLPFSAEWWNGPSFHPIPGVLSFSETLVGLSPLTTPLQWLGASPLAAYNTAFLLSFALSAFTMHLLCRSLRMSPALCVVAGLGFGFAPYRAGHLAHLQVLSGQLIPLVFLGLHRFVETGRRRWLVLFAAAWALQGLTNGYYLVFLSVLVGCWLLWFIRPGCFGTRLALVLLAWVLAALALTPVLRRYALWHARYGFERSLGEIETLSADLIDLLSPSPALAHWPGAGFHSTEAWLFPGITLPLVVAGFLATRRWRPMAEGPLATLFAAVAALAATVAAITAVTGPWRIEAAALSLSVSALRKPLAISLYGLTLAGVSSRSLRAVWQRGSVLAFYLMASGAMAVLALGPGPRAAGLPIWDKAPYWYLLQLPGVSALRAPARFAMLAVFCLALAGALALGRLVEGKGRRGMGLVALAAAGVLWDGWLVLPIREVPAGLRLAPPQPVAAVLELPLGGERDTSAMYRGTTHGLPVVNGYSGYVPPHYHALRLGLEREEPGVLGAIREHGPLLVLLDPRAPWAQATEQLVVAEPEVLVAGAEGGRRAYFLPRNRPHPPPVLGDRIASQVTRGSRHRGVFDLGEAQGIGGIRLEFGRGISGLPPRVTVEAGTAPGRWTTVWDGPVAALAVRGALRDPLRVPVVLETPGAFGRFLRIRVELWTIAEVAVFRPRSPSEADREPHRGLDPPRLELDGR